jgi:O-antigen ligase
MAGVSVILLTDGCIDRPMMGAMDATVAAARCAPAALPRPQGFVRRHAEAWAMGLLFTYFLFGFIGSNPLGGTGVAAASGEGNVLRQAVLIGLFAASLPLLFVHRWAVLQLCRRAWPLLLVYAWIAATAMWSAHPPLTLRRVIAEGLVLAVLVAAVAAARSWRTLVCPVALAAALIILVNVAAVALAPGLAIGPLGAMGIHTNKNLAGVVTLVALILIAGSMAALPSWRLRLGLVPILGLGLVFLVLTKSKTSLGLFVLAATLFPALYLVLRRWSVAPAVVPALLASGFALAVGAALALDVPASAVSEFLFGDATLTRRTELWAYLGANLEARPILGWGWGAFWDTGAEINPINAPPESWVLPAREINTAHSGYIDMWLQAGVVGLALVVAVLVRVVVRAAGLIRQGGLGLADLRLVGTLLCLALVLALYNVMESIVFRPSDTLSGLIVLTVLAVEAWTAPSGPWRAVPERVARPALPLRAGGRTVAGRPGRARG